MYVKNWVGPSRLGSLRCGTDNLPEAVRSVRLPPEGEHAVEAIRVVHKGVNFKLIAPELHTCRKSSNPTTCELVLVSYVCSLAPPHN